MLNGESHGSHTPLEIREGERVEITFKDHTTMAHPMHLHGHHFQVVAINGERFSGAVRDTVLVPARGSVTIAFDASNPGKWALHCHNLYHMAAGMMTTVEYRA
jgi:FtsP/CotA-like multicopper oxidase with cupredoxin domain